MAHYRCIKYIMSGTRKKFDALWYRLQFVVAMLINIVRRKSIDILILAYHFHGNNIFIATVSGIHFNSDFTTIVNCAKE